MCTIFSMAVSGSGCRIGIFVKGFDAMIKSVAAGAVAVKNAAARKIAAGKSAGDGAKIVERKIAAVRKKRASPKRAATPAIGPEERHHLVEVAAYYIAERRGFRGASSHEDWLQAEREVDAMIADGKFAP
jgi:hypothetical protein